MPTLSVAKEAFDVFMNIRETIAFYMFIVEESIQAVGMACYLSAKYQDYSRAKELATWAIDELINPLYDFANSPAGVLAYPMNEAYKAFAEATKKTMETYLTLEG